MIVTRSVREPPRAHRSAGAGAALAHLAVAAAEAGDPGRDGLVKRLHVPALGIPRAPEELTEAPEPHLHGATALLAYPIRPFRLNRPDTALVVTREVHGVLAVGIAAAG